MNHDHYFVLSDIHKNYEICYECGTYHSISQSDPVELYEGEYWSHKNGRSTMEEQVYNVTEIDTCGVSKIDKILEYVPKQIQSVLELGCFPGILLKKLSDKGLCVYGIEPNEKYIPFIKNYCGEAIILKGYFPKMGNAGWLYNNIKFDCIIGIDILEHIDKYDEFISGVYNKLSDNGVAIFMAPIICEDGKYRDRDMKADEHCWIFTKKFLQPYLENIFNEVKFDRWVLGHDIIICKK